MHFLPPPMTFMRFVSLIFWLTSAVSLSTRTQLLLKICFFGKSLLNFIKILFAVHCSQILCCQTVFSRTYWSFFIINSLFVTFQWFLTRKGRKEAECFFSRFKYVTCSFNNCKQLFRMTVSIKRNMTKLARGGQSLKKIRQTINNFNDKTTLWE